MKYYLFLVVCSYYLFGFSQQNDIVDFKKINATIVTNARNKSVSGQLVVEFEILKKTDSIYLDAVNMQFSNLNITKHSIHVATELVKPNFKNDLKHLIVFNSFNQGETYILNIDFSAVPKQTLYFTENQIWTQGQGKYTSHWLPSIDAMNDKIEFDLTIAAPIEKTVIANGKLIETKEKENVNYWAFNMQQPMASYLVAFAVGDFKKKTITSKSGIPIELYYKPEDEAKVEPTYRYTKEIFDFFENEIGVPYPWQNYKQVPVRDFLYAGMENTGCTIFSEAFVVDSIGFNDRNYVNVNAHELAHQWFGNLVTETSGKHHWLQEGFATYYALLAEREIFGDDYFYWKLYNSAEQLKALSDAGKGESLLNPNASSLTFYEKGAWALHILKETIGNKAFKNAIKNYLTKYAYRNVTTEDFLNEIKKAATIDISQWEQDWLLQSAFKAEQAYNSLSKSAFMNQYFEIAALRATPLNDKYKKLEEALTFPNDFIGQKAIYQLANEPFNAVEALYKKGFASNNLYVRQAIAQTTQNFTEQFKDHFFSLLNDESYLTLESAMILLWQKFSEEQAAILDQTKNIDGFQNKNIRQLWLALALLTDGYNDSAKPIYKKELQNYSNALYSFEIRNKAFEYIHQLQLYNDFVIKNLVNACTHHNWRFRNSARKLLDELLEETTFKNNLKSKINTFPSKESAYLKRILK